LHDAEGAVTGIVLAGGKSSRMGRNKALLELDGRPLIERVLESLDPFTDDRLIVTNAPEEYAHLGVTMCSDRILGQGPLSGIHAGLLAASGTLNFVVACDLPFISRGVLGLFHEEARANDDCTDWDICVAESPRGPEPLLGVYARACVPVIERLLARDKRRVVALHGAMRTRTLRFSEADLMRLGGDAFINLNTPDEYEQARRSVEGAS
jgi:molybdopterin-guanine dinucleotide biosynthesis protein A